jgi:cytochrome c553
VTAPNREWLVRFIVKYPWLTAAALATAVGCGAILVVLSGVVPINASSGHWEITDRVLDFIKVQSVRTHSLGIDPPHLDDDELIARGAAHYAVGCERCHGSPGIGVPPVMKAMTPAPPELRGHRLTRWSPEQLFTIVKHGIKFTGMPAWPVQERDDEVWSVVALLRQFPAIDGAHYRRLVQADPVSQPPMARDLEAPQQVRVICWRCHGVDGSGREGGFVPSLAGQRAAYVDAALRAFANRTRFSGTMSEIAAQLTDADIRAIAVYYERLPPRLAVSSTAASETVAIATRGEPQRELPACVECHGPTDVPKNPAYPILAGQHARYLALQLELLKQRRRGGSPRVNIMHAVVDRLRPSEIEALARYYASLSY